jgi:hypothetical protein
MATFVRWWVDGPNIYRQYLEDGRLFTVMHSTNEDAIMAENKAVRLNGGPRKSAWMRPLAQVSETQYKLLTRLNPDLCCSDGEIRRKAWRALVAKYPALGVTDP